MNKKRLISLVIALVLIFTLAGTAFADTDDGVSTAGRGSRGRYIAQVTEIGINQFTVISLRGDEYLILVDENTVFRTVEGDKAVFADLAVGLWVKGRINKDPSEDDSAFIAGTVVILPGNFDPTEIRRARGEVTEVLVSQNSFVLETGGGESLAILVDSETRFAGSISGLDDLEPGMKVGVGAVEQEDSTYLAVAVAGRFQEGARSGGTIISVGTSDFSIEDQEGSQLAFVVTEDTRFRSWQDIDGLEDLEAGMVVGVIYQSLDGVSEAKIVFVRGQSAADES